MWAYEKKLQYPVRIKNPNPMYAKIILNQLGGADGELGAAMRYLNQRYTMPYGDIIGILTDVGTEATSKKSPLSNRRKGTSPGRINWVSRCRPWQPCRRCRSPYSCPWNRSKRYLYKFLAIVPSYRYSGFRLVQYSS